MAMVRTPETSLANGAGDLSKAEPFVLGPLSVDPPARRIDSGARSDMVEPRVMRVLVALGQTPGKVLSRDDLIELCWDGRIVSDKAITRATSLLRHALQDLSDGAVRLETIPRVGFRLRVEKPSSPDLPATDRVPSARGEALDMATDGLSPAGRVASRQTASSFRRPMAIAAAGMLLLVMAAGTWLWFRPVPAAHSMMVRLSGFRTQSADLPVTMRESIDAEISAAFNVDGVIGVSAAPAPTPKTAPAYSLGGTIYRAGDSIRVITRLTNDRSGAVLWSDSTDYAPDQVSRIPHKIAINAGTVVRCGLTGAATYHKPLPDPVMSNYMHYCQEYWSYGGSKTLRFAQRVVDAVPDFSWGWSAVGNGYMQAARVEHDSQRTEALRAAGREAQDRALALDPDNSDALAHKAQLIDERDWVAREALFKRAIAARPLDCGCEHYGYGVMLESVGLLDAAIEKYRAATDMLALWPDSQLALGGALVKAGRGKQARPFLDAAIDLSNYPNVDKWIAVTQGTETGDYTAAMAALRSPQLQISQESRAALLSGYEALASGDPQTKMRAIQELVVLPKAEQSDVVAAMLAALGANRQALQIAAQRPWLFWRRSMRGVLNEPAFPAIAKQLGLMTYWKTSRTKPDVCLTKSAPPFCRMI